MGTRSRIKASGGSLIMCQEFLCLCRKAKENYNEMMIGRAKDNNQLTGNGSSCKDAQNPE